MEYTKHDAADDLRRAALLLRRVRRWGSKSGAFMPSQLSWCDDTVSRADRIRLSMDTEGKR